MTIRTVIVSESSGARMKRKRIRAGPHHDRQQRPEAPLKSIPVQGKHGTLSLHRRMQAPEEGSDREGESDQCNGNCKWVGKAI